MGGKATGEAGVDVSARVNVDVDVDVGVAWMNGSEPNRRTSLESWMSPNSTARFAVVSTAVGVEAAVGAIAEVCGAAELDAGAG